MPDTDRNLAASDMEFMEEQQAKKEKPSREVSPRMTTRAFQQFEGLRDLQRELNKKAVVRDNSRVHAMAKGRNKK